MVWRGGIFGIAVLAQMTAMAAYGASEPQNVSTYTGIAACAKCHSAIGTQWSHSRHSKMVQPATTAAVQGDFARGSVKLRGLVYGLHQRNGAFYITETYLTGKPAEHRVEYTLGNRRIQHYLTTLPDGRVIVLPPSWDIVRKQWFHNLDIDDPEEEPGVQIQVWNKSCYSCHVSQQEKNYDVESNVYKTSWLNFGTNCERCHGPGSEHVAHYSSATPPQGRVTDIVLQTRLDAKRSTMVCAQCHSFRDIYVQGFAAGADYYDYFLPVLEYSLTDTADPAFWPDGRTRRFSNDAIGLWQSECFLKGNATCVSCHVEAHQTEIEMNPQLRPDANALCTRCHEAVGRSLQLHTHHAATSAGSSCVECHMPRTVYSIKAEIRDHSMSIPVPENTINHGIPNACNLCHKDRDAAWSVAHMNEWYQPQTRRKLIRRADTFAAARKNDAGAIPDLLAMLNEPAEGPLTRANAAGYLGRFSADARAFSALRTAMTDTEPLVRMVAIQRIVPQPTQRPATLAAMVEALADPMAPVRMSALVSLVASGVRELPGEDGERFLNARRLYEARAALGADDAGQQFAVGKFALYLAEPDKAIAAFHASMKLDPTVDARYLLAGTYAEKGNVAEARKILLAIPAGDPEYDKAQRLLKAIAAQAH